MVPSPKNRSFYWSASLSDVLKELDSMETGLSSTRAKERIQTFGLNEIARSKKREFLDILVSQFRNPLILVLVLAALVSLFLGERIDAVVIIAIVLLNALLGFFQEFKAEKALDELKKYVTVQCRVLRDGHVLELDAKEVVPGDIAIFHLGDVIPADIRLMECNGLTTDESTLTGESVPVEKRSGTISLENAQPTDLKNLAFMGTIVSGGFGHGVVVATGNNTFFGKTANYLRFAEPKSDFEKNIGRLSALLLRVIAVMTLFIFLVNWFLGKDLFESFLFALALAVGITPEALPIIITMSLSRGALRLAKKKVVTKKLVAIEDLGNIDTLCSDKTGTLTEGEIELKDFVSLDGTQNPTLLLYGLLCNSAQVGKHHKHVGNAIDRAIWNSKDLGLVESALNGFQTISQNDFDYDRKRMSVLVRQSSQTKLIVKGAPDSILGVCSTIMQQSKRLNISPALRSKLSEKIISLESDGYNVISIAEKALSGTKTDPSDEKDLTLLGFLLFLDPPKKSAKDSLKLFQKLGVRIKILSGDSAIVTRKVCNEVGLEIEENRVVSGAELDALDGEKFEECIQRYNVFARVTPEQKYQIVSSLNKEGHIVGFLGDGVNDAPALKAADVGIAVDSGTGVAKEAASIILLKKSLHVLAEGIVEGRKTFGNITKYLLNTVSANNGNMMTVALSSLFLPFIPLLPSQILLNNFLSDVPALTISSDNVDPEFLKKPKRWNLKFISQSMVYFGLISTFFDLLLILPLLFIFQSGPSLFRTAWFVESAISEIIIMFVLRTHFSVFKSVPGKWLVISSIAVGAVCLALPFTGIGSAFFEFVPLPFIVLAYIAGVLACYFAVTEFLKFRFFKKFESY